MMAC